MRDANYLTNMKKRVIYADHAATTPLSEAALEAMKPYLETEYGNPSAIYSAARAPKKAVAEARKRIAAVIGSLPEEIYFTSCGTESDNWAIKGTAFRFIGQKKRIITSCVEHHAVLHSCAFLEKLGFEVIYLPVNTKGMIPADVLLEAMNDNTILASVILANNEIGTIEDIQTLVEAAHQRHILFHTDAVQAVGHIPVNVNELGVDFMSASAHKFGGPKGVGFLYKRKNVELEPFMCGGSQESGQRAGTENVAGIVGMAAALTEAASHMVENEKYLNKLVERFKSNIQSFGLDCVYNGTNNRIPGSISISFRGVEGEMLLHRLDLKGIFVSTGSACNSESIELSHVIKAISVPDEYAKGTIRITLGLENTLDDVDCLVSGLNEILSVK